MSCPHHFTHATSPGVWVLKSARVCQLDASGRVKIVRSMTSKRPHPDSAGLFLSRKSASDIANGDIDAFGSYIVGRIFSKNPARNQYTVDIRRDANAKAAYLDVVIEDKLQKRLELLVGDHLHISLKGAQLISHTGPASHLPVLLRFREGITILLAERAGLQGEKGKLFHVWPGSSTYSAVVRLSL